jgi:hypothetical protein
MPRYKQKRVFKHEVQNPRAISTSGRFYVFLSPVKKVDGRFPYYEISGTEGSRKVTAKSGAQSIDNGNRLSKEADSTIPADIMDIVKELFPDYFQK